MLKYDVFESMMLKAVDAGVAGTGRHTWLLADGMFIRHQVYEPDDPMRRALMGSGVLMASGGVAEHMPVLDRYLQQWRSLSLDFQRYTMYQRTESASPRRAYCSFVVRTYPPARSTQPTCIFAPSTQKIHRARRKISGNLLLGQFFHH